MNQIYFGDAESVLQTLPPDSVDCCVTSPPYYGLRDYGVSGQIGLEATPNDYIARLVNVFREVKRVLRADGTLWIVIGDSYAGSGKGRMRDGTHSKGRSKSNAYESIVGGILYKTHADGCKPKDLIGIPWMLAFALRDDGWFLRQDIIWHKTNPMPESVKDRCTKCHEYIFLLSKSPKYYFDADGISEPAHYDGRKATINKGSLKYAAEGIYPQHTPQSSAIAGKAHERWRFKDGQAVRSKRSVWTVPTGRFKGAHFATFPPELVTPCIIAGCREGGTVLDPFCGSGTTLQVAHKTGRNGIGIELNPDYEPIINNRIGNLQ